MKTILILFALGCVAGCATTESMDDATVRGAGSCTVPAGDRFVGQRATSELGAEVLRVTTADRLRWITPDTIVTADYREDRVNVRLDDTNRVTEIDCG